MSRRPKTEYAGRGSWIQVQVSDAEHAAVSDKAKALGLSNAAYVRLLLEQAGEKPVVQLPNDPIRPENLQFHKHLEAVLESLDEARREHLARVLETFAPRSKGKRTS